MGMPGSAGRWCAMWNWPFGLFMAPCLTAHGLSCLVFIVVCLF